jgi:spore coat polysaccharide biosynthesis predicted glycosyltransferase SpsG
MRLVFRADASPDLGTGHVMRCSSIAEEALARKIPCVFVGSMGGVRWIEERLAVLGIPVTSVSDFIAFGKSDLLILDSYLKETQDGFIMQNDWSSTVVIVDEATPLPEADLYIHPGLDSSWFLGDRKKLLCGSKFIPLRNAIEKRRIALGGRIEKIVVFGGGTDTFGFAHAISQILSNMPGFSYASFFSAESLEIEKRDSRFREFEFGGLLDIELSLADLVFTTASTSSLEIVAREIPLGVACSVPNQHAYFETLKESGVAVQIGDRTRTGSWNLDSRIIRDLISNPGIRSELSKASKNFIDLDGASRIIDAIEAL